MVCGFVCLGFSVRRNYLVEMLVSSHPLFKQILKYPHLIIRFVMSFLTSQSRMRLIVLFSPETISCPNKNGNDSSETFQVEVGGDNV